MNKIKQRFPNFVYVDPETWIESEFEALEDLLKIDWIKDWSNRENFYRFSTGGSNELIAEYDQGKRFYFIGRFMNNQIDLPKWVRRE